MHIKKIVIQGFKTYKDQTVIDGLSSNCNIVVGRNGSGKSNFFAAIRFVLSDAYTHMTREERQGLLHDGSGTIMSAYVEVIFDNSDGRFPISNTEVSIRRTIGLKKDDYSLDGKSATRSDIMNLLESAGFSRSNPYYIVPQGRITSLTNSKDHERLTLLKEVSGATVFEIKLKESMKEMNQSNLKRQRIDEALKNIEEKISDLQIESDDLKEFQSLEKQKKVLEYNIFDREFNDLNETLEELEQNHQQILLESSKDLKEMEEREKLCTDLQNTMNELNLNLNILKTEKEQSDLDCNQILKSIAEKEVQLNELREKLDSSNERFNEIDAQIKENLTQISEISQEIKKTKPQLEKLQSQESNLKKNLHDIQTKQRALYSKQSRFQKHESKDKRDAWLTEEISNLKSQSNEKDQDIQQYESELRTKQMSQDSIKQRLEEINGTLNSDESIIQIEDLKTSIQDLKTRINQCVDQRKSMWREEVKLKSMFDSLTNDLNNASSLVSKTMDRSQAQGIAAVDSITKRLKLEDHVFGTVAELFSVNEKYKVAAEVIAGNSLFHVVVDTDETAAILIEELTRTKQGRVTFIPLNRIDVVVVEYPDPHENQCLPLISKLKFNQEQVGKAMNQIFGKALVVKELQKGSELSRKFKLTCTTLDGDRVDVKGVLSGGYRDFKTSRLDAIKLQAKKKSEIVKTESEINQLTQDLNDVNQKMTKLNNDLQLSLRDLENLTRAKEPLEVELSQLTAKKFNADQEIHALTSNIDALKSSKNTLLSNIKQYENELNSEFTQALDEEELKSLEEYNKEITKLELQLDEVVTSALDWDTKVGDLETELINIKNANAALNLEKKSLGERVSLNSDINSISQDLETLQIQLDSNQTRNDEITRNYAKITEELRENEKVLTNSNEQQLKTMENFEKFNEKSIKLLNLKSIKEQTREEINSKIKNLGMLPEEAFQSDKFENFSANQLITKLNKILKELTKYQHINKRAMEQYNQFNKQKDDLIARKDELDESKRSIENLIKVLQKQKKDSIMNSFKQISKAFHEIFEKLVPQGTGHLILQKKNINESQHLTQTQITEEENGENSNHSSSDDLDSDNEGQEDDTIDNYTGVSISVSFNSKEDEQQKIEQLSGGQKSLCAIALIFAIQQCDPAPFYLFDEIDSNLDTQYRTSVASLINSLGGGDHEDDNSTAATVNSNNAQFICTTFRPELISLAGDKFYGVVFANKVSNIIEINKAEAMNFVEGQVRT
ncbi:SMC3 [Candida pseudojiufengensis]|uniref:SMC3 n=1 Tax=Candida pseudojiufengensis TaxID=497109 RepID=UPI0022256A7D|nr:SMC3 [Candida pseudojiufengensis]KAI5959598.1 SMC3 [Candida pseudojiufengensis]